MNVTRNGHGGRGSAPRKSRAYKPTTDDLKNLDEAGLKPRFAVPAEAAAGHPPIPLNSPPEAVPFPLDILPAPLRRFVEEAAHATNTPTDFTAVPLLGAAGGAIGNRRRLQVKRSRCDSACLWAVVVGRPGSGKSAPLSFVAAPFHRAEARFRQQHDRKKRAKWDSALAEGGEPGQKPTMHRCLTDDATIESLVRILAQNPEGVLMVRDELSALLGGLNQYKTAGRGNDRQHLISIWSGMTVTKDRKNLDDEPITVPRPFLAIIGGIQPDVLHSFRIERQQGGGLDDGFLDRFLFSYAPERPAIGERWRELSEDAEDQWQDVVDRLMALKMAGKKPNPCPVNMPLTREGCAEWQRATDAHAAERSADEFPSYLNGAWVKMDTYLGRLALIMQLLRYACGEAEAEAVDGRSVRDAAQLLNYFKAHTKRCYTVMGADPRIAKAMLVLRWLMGRHDLIQFKRSQAWEALRKSFLSLSPNATPEGLNRPLALLIEHRYLEPVEAGQTDQKVAGRRPTDSFRVNISWIRQINPINPIN